MILDFSTDVVEDKVLHVNTLKRGSEHASVLEATNGWSRWDFPSQTRACVRYKGKIGEQSPRDEATGTVARM